MFVSSSFASIRFPPPRFRQRCYHRSYHGTRLAWRVGRLHANENRSRYEQRILGTHARRDRITANANPSVNNSCAVWASHSPLIKFLVGKHYFV